MNISGIITTLNEEANIADAIASLQQVCDEIVVVDSESSDRTVEIAREMGKEEVTWASRFSGMKIEKVSDNKWNLNFSGLFAFDNSSYQTEFTMTATSLNENKHANWEVTISGNRSEREGYRCTFESLGAITYQTLGGETGWSQLFGRLSMLVFDKDGKKDGCLLQLAGAPSQAQFVRGL